MRAAFSYMVSGTSDIGKKTGKTRAVSTIVMAGAYPGNAIREEREHICRALSGPVHAATAWSLGHTFPGGANA